MSIKKRGLLLVMDGMDCAGKSTQLKLLSMFLNQVGIQHLKSREENKDYDSR